MLPYHDQLVVAATGEVSAAGGPPEAVDAAQMVVHATQLAGDGGVLLSSLRLDRGHVPDGDGAWGRGRVFKFGER